MKVEHLASWTDLKNRLSELKKEAAISSLATEGDSQSDLLYRGHGSDKWLLETTFDRAKPKHRWLADYYSQVKAAISVADSLTTDRFAELDLQKVNAELRAADHFFPQPLPHYDLLIYLRHLGFPSPLLDWSRSQYVASYFAFEQPQGERVALYVYQEKAGSPKYYLASDSHLVTLGPWVKTHARHVLQQAQYTMAIKQEDNLWGIALHEDVFSIDSKSQDRLIKLTVPANQASEALDELEEMNINAYSLFQSQDSLFRTIGRRIFR